MAGRALLAGYHRFPDIRIPIIKMKWHKMNILRLSYLYNRESYSGRIAFLYQNSPQDNDICGFINWELCAMNIIPCDCSNGYFHNCYVSITLANTDCDMIAGTNRTCWYGAAINGLYFFSLMNRKMNGLLQKRRNSSALALEVHFFCTNPSM